MIIPPPDKRLLAALALRAQQGDERAWDELFTALHPRLVGWLCHKGWGLDDADDLASITFARAARYIQKYDPQRAGFETWLWWLASSQAINLWHTHQRRTLHYGVPWSLDTDTAPPLPEGSPGPEEQALWRETVREAWALVQAQGSRTQRRTFAALLEYGDLTSRELGDMLGLKTGTAKSAIFHLRPQVVPRLEWSL